MMINAVSNSGTYHWDRFRDNRTRSSKKALTKNSSMDSVDSTTTIEALLTAEDKRIVKPSDNIEVSSASNITNGPRAGEELSISEHFRLMGNPRATAGIITKTADPYGYPSKSTATMDVKI